MHPRRNKLHFSIIFAVLAALFYGFSAPIAKLLLVEVSPYLMSSLLYFGAGIGMAMIVLLSRQKSTNINGIPFQKYDTKYIVMMVLLDIAAPILLMVGLTMTAASTASLLNNLEIVFTALIALLFFKEVIGPKMWISIFLILTAGILLSVDDFANLHFSGGALLIIGASIAWGLENNCTRMLSKSNPLHVVIIKGFGSGLGSLVIALALNQWRTPFVNVVLVLVLGFFTFGLSLYFYISAQRHLGAARTSAYYAIAPFAGAGLSFLILNEGFSASFAIAAAIMVIGTYLAVKENSKHLSEAT